MPIDDVCTAPLIGKVVVTGVVADGEVRPGDRLVLRGGELELPVTVEGLEAQGRPVGAGRRGDRIGVLLCGVAKIRVGTGVVLASPDLVPPPKEG
jgi:translation elongation factor EF-Tu-like GTPase